MHISLPVEEIPLPSRIQKEEDEEEKETKTPDDNDDDDNDDNKDVAILLDSDEEGETELEPEDFLNYHGHLIPYRNQETRMSLRVSDRTCSKIETHVGVFVFGLIV